MRRLFLCDFAKNGIKIWAFRQNCLSLQCDFSTNENTTNDNKKDYNMSGR